ncbi:hypothetical protein FPV63_01475 [Vibrio cholerae]|nr:hypothetical protein FPV63_01475 [Vibrio cholerae]
MNKLTIKEEMSLDSIPVLMMADILAHEERAGKWIDELKIDFESDSVKQNAYTWLRNEKKINVEGMSEHEAFETFLVVLCYHVMALKRGVIKGNNIKLK